MNGHALPGFPVDPATLDLLMNAVRPDPNMPATSLNDFLRLMSELGGSDPNAVAEQTCDNTFVMRDQGYHPNDVIAALIDEVRRLRAAPA